MSKSTKTFKERSTQFGKDLQALMKKHSVRLRPRAILMNDQPPIVEVEIFDAPNK